MSARAAHRQVLAQRANCDILPFARAPRLADSGCMSIAACVAGPDVTMGLPCYTFPLNWPSPARVGSFFWRKPAAEISSQVARDSVDSIIITTNDRGTSCGNLLCLAFWPCHLQLVWITTFSAAFWARALAPRLRRLQAAIWSRARLWAAFSAPSATTSASAARGTKTLSAFGPVAYLGSNGLIARLALFACAQRILPRALARLWPYQELAHV
jgi:hypothetical protein